MTVIEALGEAKNTLNSISIPVPLLHQIGMPINTAVSLIQASIDAFVNESEKPEGKEDAT